jgi:pulcherriminic acid synthase
MREVDLHSEEFAVDPFPTFEYLRHEKPVFWDKQSQRWIISRYQDVTDVFKNHELFTAQPYSRMTDIFGLTLAHMDGKDHDARRSIAAPAMVGKRLEEVLMPSVVSASAELVAGIQGTRKISVREHLAHSLPLKTMSLMLGLESEDEKFLSDITGGVIQALSGEEPFKSIGQQRHLEFAQVVRRLMAQRREVPTDDLLSSLMNSSDGKGFFLSEEEICSFMTLLLIAGVETTELGLLNFWYRILQYPEFIPRLAEDDDFLNGAFTEFMRMDGPVAYEDRTLSADHQLHGVEMKAGDVVRVAMISANNDHSIFANPRDFNPERSDLVLEREHRSGGVHDGRANHVGFGLGKHFCIGYLLARAEITELTKQFLRSTKPRLAADHVGNIQMHWLWWSVEDLILELQ